MVGTTEENLAIQEPEVPRFIRLGGLQWPGRFPKGDHRTNPQYKDKR